MLSTKRKMSVKGPFFKVESKTKRRRQSPCRGGQIANATRTFGGGALPISNRRNKNRDGRLRNNKSSKARDKKVKMLKRLKESE